MGRTRCGGHHCFVDSSTISGHIAKSLRASSNQKSSWSRTDGVPVITSVWVYNVNKVTLKHVRVQRKSALRRLHGLCVSLPLVCAWYGLYPKFTCQQLGFAWTDVLGDASTCRARRYNLHGDVHF
ncbi:hypothetical protein GY45DRAFT_576134 [Cubamyces sp. BRFM 1775]|nr:hypothetical protein GY45DRAFT_576134 [Cubamyces sp. BRFM 1775]